MQYIRLLAFIATAISVVAASPLSVENALKRDDVAPAGGEDSTAITTDKTVAAVDDVLKPDPDCFILYPCINW
ncbi:hypothetical protein FB451DRAFT_1414729 [Mycena latifolia]|nr:hypothetical protein FB451DRAFT_1414729 [Mycena latifolia]